MQLTGEAVRALVAQCLFEEGAPTDSAILVEGVVLSYGFDPARISKHSEEIGALLRELPAPFHKETGGGWTFLNACQDRDGNQWTGSHLTMEMLFCLGIAAGRVEWLLPRELWSALPGGMPYVVVE